MADGGDDGMATVVAGLVVIGVCRGIGGADMDGLTTRSASRSRVAGAVDACGAGRLDRAGRRSSAMSGSADR
jgi:hypothetical protein